MSYRKYLELSKKYLEEGKNYLAKGDLVQTSEKVWGSVAEAVKAAADKRGWEHSRHHHLETVISRLIEETKDVELGRLYSVAERLHANFYENFATLIEVEAYIEDAKKLIEKLEKLTI
ncbi:MAG: Archaeal PaREP1/PaREP8 family protein [Candidatus Bathyarchaeota archaeon BA2]|nr:MAG: Archaeal PaREP1/PaREP8 family protein [Candidatus Bathyarchaeota archaeon BA2]